MNLTLLQGANDILAHIKPIDPKDLPKKNPVVLLFVTPSQSRCLQQEFQKKVVEHLFERAASTTHLYGKQISILGVIVDRLPPQPRGSGPKLGGSSYQVENGLAYAVLEDGNIEEGLVMNKRDRMSNQASRLSGSIIFRAPYPKGPSTLGNSQSNYLTDCQVQVPLANTIFETGRHTTMLLSRWRFPIASDSPSSMPQFVDERFLDHVFLNWPANRNAWTCPEKAKLTVPLVPLTEPRRVQAAMGNIVRKLEGPGKSTLLASQELEVSVAKYFKENDIPPQAIGVWALLIPQEYVNIASKHSRSTYTATRRNGTEMKSSTSAITGSDDMSKSRWADIVQELIANGARLHRVQSGGGGWGKKAGLLSLDPDTDFGPEGYDFSRGKDTALPDHEIGHYSQVLDSITLSDDYIQFFTANTRSLNTHLAGNEEPMSAGDNVTSICFGTSQSSADAPPDVSSPVGGEHEILPHAFHGRFGAFAEAGICLRMSTSNDSSEHFLLRTKIDVPSSSLELIYSANSGTSK